MIYSYPEDIAKPLSVVMRITGFALIALLYIGKYRPG